MTRYQIQVKQYPKFIEEFAKENFNLKTLIGALIALMLVNSLVVAYLLRRGPMVVPLQADGTTARLGWISCVELDGIPCAPLCPARPPPFTAGHCDRSLVGVQGPTYERTKRAKQQPGSGRDGPHVCILGPRPIVCRRIGPGALLLHQNIWNYSGTAVAGVSKQG